MNGNNNFNYKRCLDNTDFRGLTLKLQLGFELQIIDNKKLARMQEMNKTTKPATRAGFNLFVIRIGFEPMALSLEG